MKIFISYSHQDEATFMSPKIDENLALLVRKLQQLARELPASPKVVGPDVEDRDKLPPVRRLPKKHYMPYRPLADRFVGRVKDLWDLGEFEEARKLTEGED